MSASKRISGGLAAIVIGAALAALVGCGPRAGAPGHDRIEAAVALFIDERYDESLASLEALLEGDLSDGERREVYYYIGRCHVEKGEVGQAIEAFATAVRLGDHGASLEYLDELRPEIEGTARAVSHLAVVSRGQLCALVERWVAKGTGRAPRLDPIRAAIESGWIEALPDGEAHADAPITPASFHIFVLRLCRSVECAGAGASTHYPPGDGTLSGREVIAALQRVLPWPAPDAR